MSCDAFIENLSKTLPELLSAKDLVTCGIYSSEQAAYVARKKGNCPPYFQIPFRGIRYPKQGVLDFMKKASFQPKKLRF